MRESDYFAVDKEVIENDKYGKTKTRYAALHTAWALYLRPEETMSL